MTPEEVKTGEETAVEEETVIDNVIVDRIVVAETAVEIDRKLRDYELVLVISPEVTEERFEAIIDNVSQFVTGKGGVITNTDRWGKRSLAYPIKHNVDGNYVLARFKMMPVFGKELESNLRISSEVLRHLLIKMDN
ncbi:30S ribosomal protein S6 [Chloroflexota bacterium]